MKVRKPIQNHFIEIARDHTVEACPLVSYSLIIAKEISKEPGNKKS